MTFGEPDESGGEQAMTELLGRGRNFTAVACYNDSMAAGAMGVLNDNGIDVPGEISLIGFDDVLVSRYVRPRLTTVRYPIVTMATGLPNWLWRWRIIALSRKSLMSLVRRWYVVIQCQLRRWRQVIMQPATNRS